MFHWIPYPFVRIVFFFISGIVLATQYRHAVPRQIVGSLLVLLGTAFLGCVFLNTRRKKLVVNPGWWGLTLVLGFGWLNADLYDQSSRPHHLLQQENDIDAYRGVIMSAHEEKTRSWKQLLEVSEIHHANQWRKASGNVLIYYDKDFHSQPFAYGDVVIVAGKPDIVPPPANPSDFDYQKFLSFRNIFHQHFIRGTRIHTVGRNAANPIIALSLRLRAFFEQQICKAIKGSQEQAIASALVLGITDRLDNEVTHAYAATGSMHVLAVSGLHVGILYMIVGFLLRPLQRSMWGRWVLAAVSIAALWSYACLTGLSPSVLRAVTMFSFVALGKPLGYRTNIYNTLAASAFFLLLVNPNLIFSVGFRLSYLAVIGIVYLHPPLYHLFEPRWKFIDDIWKVSCVSIAAQLATFPLGLFYFHQFPNYFLISNLFVIPLAFCILLGSLLMLSVSWIEPLFRFIGFVIDHVIRLLNYMIFLVEDLPFSSTTGIHITGFQCAMLIALVGSLVLFLQYRRVWYFYGSVAILFVCATVSWLSYLEIEDRQRLVVYKLAKRHAVDIFSGEVVYVFADPASPIPVSTDDKTGMYTPFRPGVVRSSDGDRQPFVRPFGGGKTIRWKGRTILILFEFKEDVVYPGVDIVIVSGRAMEHVGRICKKINPAKIILDSSNSYFVADKALKSLTQTVNVHSVWHHGAFEENW